MKTTEQKRKDCWRCDRCGKKTDTLYFFIDKLNICGECRDSERRFSGNGRSLGKEAMTHYEQKVKEG